MFDFAADPSENPHIAPPRVLALDLIVRSSASLRRIASHLGGDAGLALICVLCDMIVDPTVDPLHWPIDEAIALLRQPAAGRDAEVDRLARQLERIWRSVGEEPPARAA
ncbi:MAG: hypothetical protein ABTQ27_09505 [Amaricoccus sp.]|uniref:hypothetical protein n=1 Tax=Amaricoccus sp. TaxID=1872485 RepID=UPI0033162350